MIECPMVLSENSHSKSLGINAKYITLCMFLSQIGKQMQVYREN